MRNFIIASLGTIAYIVFVLLIIIYAVMGGATGAQTGLGVGGGVIIGIVVGLVLATITVGLIFVFLEINRNIRAIREVVERAGAAGFPMTKPSS